MAHWRDELQSRPGVCDVSVFVPHGADPLAPPTLLLELPHGATLRSHYDAVRAGLHSPLPDRLEAFFFVNTDVGSPEVAVQVACMAAQPQTFPDLLAACHGIPLARTALVVRSLIPRTFIDCNRAADADASALKAGALTGLLPEYITHAADRAWLFHLHASYQEVATRAWDVVAAAGGLGVALHTYAPKSVDITTVDADIVRALEAAYAPENWSRWPERPQVDVMSEDHDGRALASRELVAALRDAYARAGITAAENATYRLHPATMGAQHAARHPGRALSVELRRDLLADPFDPFEEMRIGAAQARRMAVPLAATLLGHGASATLPSR